MASANCNKQNSRRSSAHAAYYGNVARSVQKRKDANVLKSSHGKYSSAADLNQARAKTEEQRRIKPTYPEPLEIQGVPKILRNDLANALRMTI